MSTKLTKAEIKRPDMILAKLRQGMQWIYANSKVVFMALAVIVAATAAVTGYEYLQQKNEAKAQANFYILEKEYLDIKNPQMDPTLDKAKKVDAPKDYTAVLQKFDDFIKQHPKSQAARMAAITSAGIQWENKSLDAAMGELKKVENNLDNDLLSMMVREHIGNIMAEQKNCDGAIAEWQKVLNNKRAAYLHDEVKLRMGLCYETKGDKTKAKELYTEVRKNKPEGAHAKAAGNYIRLMEITN